ncbi:hypothetical protein [Sandaracinus amylolyticus]|uniref:hypothetical protein n=1 Tax=Sandaracinus amylolyticus TaxID=927083 RepID=UPI001F1B0269|nr:hypothetical protein [Sandaracinus amylolyticus]UJR84283.1 Hypothetical protein I5071_63610 [Sandaracinus amylolyticus]
MRSSDIVRDDHDEVGKLIVSLALVFNDLKGLVTALWFLRDAMKLARGDAQNGQLSGMVLQNARWMVGLVHELLDLVRERGAVVDSAEFRSLLNAVGPEARTAWEAIEAVARGREGGDPTLRDALVRCRNSVAFHYDDKRGKLWRGFLSAFGDEPPPNVAVGRPAFSDGDNMEGSRFYFADAAAKAAVEPLIGMPFEVVSLRASDLGRRANEALKPLVVAHIRGRADQIEPYSPPAGWQWPK